MRVTEDYNLAVINPTKAQFWHPTLNGDTKPTDVMPESHKPVWWLCPNCKTETRQRIDRFTHHQKCPTCTNIAQYKTITDTYLEGNSLRQTSVIHNVCEITVKKALAYHNIIVRPSSYYNECEKNQTINQIQDEVKKQIIKEYLTTKKSKKDIRNEYNLSLECAKQLLLGISKLISKQNGYTAIKLDTHHKRGYDGKVTLHTLYAEQKLGRAIKPNEQIHHIDFDKKNYNMDNLSVGSPKQHGFWHKTCHQIMCIIMPALLASNMIVFTEKKGYEIDLKLLGKFQKKFCMTRRDFLQKK